MQGAPAYQRALSEIYALDKFGSKLGLERIAAISGALGNPQHDYKCILVAGSNGKGSTTQMIGAILREQGFKVGTYFSPQVEEFPERIRINDGNASIEEIAFAYDKVRRACDMVAPKSTFFEVVTAMALRIFATRKVDYAVLEVGLGGRLDATNAIEPEISAITSLSLEHTDVLGSTIGKIAREKCGIAREGKRLVCGILSEDAKKAVEAECGKNGARPIFVQDNVTIENIAEMGGRYSFKAKYRGDEYAIRLSACGKFQISNACVALAVACALGAGKQAIEEGLADAKPRYRFEQIGSSPKVIADCAHNPEAAVALAGEVKLLSGRKILLFSAMSDKDYRSVLFALAPFFDEIVITHVELARGADIGKLSKAAKLSKKEFIAIKDAKDALREAKRRAGRKGTVVVAGSIYLLAELFGKDKIRIAQ